MLLMLCVCWVLSEGGHIDFCPHVSSAENPLIAFVLLPVSLSSVSLPLMKLQMNWPPPSCLSLCARSPACMCLQISLHTSLSLLLLLSWLISLFIPLLLHSFSLLLSLSSSCFHAFLALLSHFHSSRLFGLCFSFPSTGHSFLFSNMEGSDDANM